MSALPAAVTPTGINKVHPWCAEEKLPFNAHHEFTKGTGPSQLLAAQLCCILHIGPSQVTAGSWEALTHCNQLFLDFVSCKAKHAEFSKSSLIRQTF